MNLLMISGERGIVAGKKTPFWYTLELLRTHFTRIDVICPRTTSVSPTLQPFENVFFHPSPWPLLLQPLWIKRKGAQLHALHHVDTMTVLEYPPFYNGIGAKLLAHATRIPYALEIHHIVGDPVPSSFSERVGRALSRMFLSFDASTSAAVRVVNRNVGEKLAAWGVDRGKISVVSSFYLDTSLLRPDLSVEKRYDLVFCGRIAKNKGLPELLAALSDVPEATLLVIGEGPEKKRCEDLAQSLKLSGRVTFAGWLPTQADVMRAVQSAKIFVMNSRSEGGPRVALEAMACGMPVIATKVGVMPDVIHDGENGMLVEMDKDDLIRAIRLLLRDSVRRERMAHSAVGVMGGFERNAAIAHYASFLASLARGSS